MKSNRDYGAAFLSLVVFVGIIVYALMHSWGNT